MDKNCEVKGRIQQINEELERLVKTKRELEEELKNVCMIGFSRAILDFYPGMKWGETSGYPSIRISGKEWFGGLASEINDAGYMIWRSSYEPETNTTLVCIKRRN